MKRIVPLQLSDTTLVYVEMDELDRDLLVEAEKKRVVKDQPLGSELTSAADKTIEAMNSLQGGLRDVIHKVGAALADSNPTSWKLELNIGFKGKTSPLPVILSGEANAALKLQVEWRRSSQ